MERAITERPQAALVEADWRVMREQANVLVKSGFMPPYIKTPEQALAVMLTGHELGLPPMQAIRSVTIIKQVPTVKPETMLGMCIQRIPGFRFQWGECTDKTATITVLRPGMESPFPSKFTMDDAKRAGLLEKEGFAWRQYPANMLRWRALGNALHACCGDVLIGVYTPEEMGADVDADGGILDASFVDMSTGEILDETPPQAHQEWQGGASAAKAVSEANQDEPATEKQIELIKKLSKSSAWKGIPEQRAEFCSGAINRKSWRFTDLTKAEGILMIEALMAADKTFHDQSTKDAEDAQLDMAEAQGDDYAPFEEAD